jgi:hypothetical protein
MAWTDVATIDLSTGDLLTETEYDAIINNLDYLKDAIDSVIILAEVQTAGTEGGTFTSGAWQTRTLNTEVVDVNGNCALSSNQFTLDAGTYEIFASAPAHEVAGNQIRLQNTTAASTIYEGTSERFNATSGQTGRSFLRYRFTVAASQALELQHKCVTTRATDGFGVALSLGTNEIYSIVYLRKVA